MVVDGPVTASLLIMHSGSAKARRPASRTLVYLIAYLRTFFSKSLVPSQQLFNFCGALQKMFFLKNVLILSKGKVLHLTFSVNDTR